MKIGIYAGTFDPIHRGHVAFAKHAVSSAGLDRVVIVAEKDPYRKKPHASWDHRQAMVERATEPTAQVDHDYEFANRLAHQHTMLDMLTQAQSHYGQDHQYWFLAGSDIFEHIHQWQDMIKHDSYGGFVVALRDDHTAEWLDARLNLLNEQGAHFKLAIVPSEHPHVSSSGIRSLVASHGESADLPLSVAEYITRHNLYQAS